MQQEDHCDAWSVAVDNEAMVAEAPLDRRRDVAQHWTTTRRGGWFVIHRTWGRRVIRSFQHKILQYPPDTSLIRLDCDVVTTPFNDTIQYSPTTASSPITFFLISYFPGFISMRISTTDPFPPIVMSSSCTVVKICSSLMQPCCTREHAIHLVNLRSLSVDASSSSNFATARFSAPPAAASRRRVLALPVSYTPSRPTSRAHWTSLVVPCQSPPILSWWVRSPSHAGTSLFHILASCLGA